MTSPIGRPPLDDVTFVIRRCGERTQSACESVIAAGVPVDQIVRVETEPFAEALAEGHRRGIRERRTWTMCVDADVIVDLAAVEVLVHAARLQRREVVEVQGMVADKFFGIPRPAGNHLYRTAALSEALACIDGGIDDLRPETTSLRNLRRRGYRDLQLPTVVGVHDFEQSFADIYRKNFLQAFKHRRDLQYLRDRFSRRADSDADFRIALRAIEDGLRHRGEVRVDRRFRPDDAAAAMNDLGLDPKPPLADADELIRPGFFEPFRERSSAGALRIAKMNQHYFLRSAEPTRWQRRASRWKGRWIAMREGGGRYAA